jgi:hypothetical protein
MIEISDDYMRAKLQKVRSYTAVLLKKGPAYQDQASRTPEQAKIVWEHGRRNMALNAEGIMALVGPIAGGGDLVGLCVFTVPEGEARTLMDGDGGVQAGVFVYDVVTWFGFPGDGLPSA